MCEHSPGPWEVRDKYDVFIAGTLGIVAAAWGQPMPTMEEVLAIRAANARLIAASPDLLAACETLVEFVAHFAKHDPYGPNSALADAERLGRAAIAKARGNNGPD